ncbi:MAG: nucleotidyltransferase domain-containing protein [Elusimicrobia bacterium]|nr:nucleotidyltransferase domain-containing protein [Elusimicrobiota bacterium]
MKLRSISGCAALLLFLSAGTAFGRIDFTDVLDAPPEFLETAEKTLWRMVDELSLRNEVKELAVVGSMACGIARLEHDPDPSDIDFLVVLDRPWSDKSLKTAAIDSVRFKYQKLLQRRLDSQLTVDIKISPNDNLNPNDSSQVWYSLTERRIHHRPGNRKRNLTGMSHQGVFYAYDRDEHNRFLASRKAKPVKIHPEVEGDQLVWYERAAWEQGKKVILLKSLSKK